MNKIISEFALTLSQQEGLFTDSRDGKSYRIVKIGSQIWMAENLNYATEGSKYYNNDHSNGQKYGRLYDWNTAKEACPSGWHLPSRSEWEELDKVVGGEKVAGKKLKAEDGWNEGGNGMDEFGFSALPGGRGYSDGSFSSVGDSFCSVGGSGYWWSASEFNSNCAYYRLMCYLDEYAYWGSYGKSNLFSVRCVKD